ncbi:MAG: mannose-1-phosphate guanylyltransferase [Candidatus Hydrogenedentes bacterium]|nr:mannose-1-phosphate guanylyltransferase [Candidatus Hydrogenedentota bacterium]
MQGRLRCGVILAGGAGERFWPLSRKHRPKQLLHLANPDRSMLGEAIDRIQPVIRPENIYVITGPHLVEPIRAAGIGIPDANIVAEPHKRNTAGALAYITAHILAKHPDLAEDQVSLAVVTADHRIEDDALFQRTVQTALDAAETQDALVICGIVPATPETGFGYIQCGDAVSFKTGDIPMYEVRAFHEKPNRERAQDFVASGNYFWNSGMFFWKVSTFLGELRAIRPDLSGAVLDMKGAMRAGDAATAAEIFEKVEDVSIDYALMEHAKHVLMVRGSFPWGDIGLWPALQEIYPYDDAGNCALGNPVIVDSKGCIVINDAGEEVAVGVAGMEDVVVVVTKDAVLVVPKDRSQDVRHIVAELKKRNAKQV